MSISPHRNNPQECPYSCWNTNEVVSCRKEPLAVIGLACRFAGNAADSKKLWQMLLEQRSAAGPVPLSRFDSNSYYHPDPDHGGTCATRRGYFLQEDIHALDTSLFNLTASEVASMDPQQKLLLESVFHALENAGLPLDQVAGSVTSVFVGASNNDHLALANTDLEILQKHRATGTSPSILSNRVSWFYDLRGTSQTIDTACSSSLVAFHQACTTLQSGQSNMAIVSGVNLIEHPASSMQLSALGVLSPDGKCFSFDHRANGYGRGEGVGTVIIKPLNAALRDGDTVRAIVRGTGSNQDGKTPGISLPSPEAQEALIKQVYDSSGIDVLDTGYIEAHGTGTPVGDPLEVRAIARAFRIAERTWPLHIGSVKANLGHLEGGAGMAGLIKVILMLEAGIIPGLANFEKLNPKLQGLPNLVFPETPTPWPERAHVRRASINSFGFGGTNSHVVLECPKSFLNNGQKMNGHSSAKSSPITPQSVSEKTNGVKHDSVLTPPEKLKNKSGSVNNTPTDIAINGKYPTDVSNLLVFMLSASDQPGLVRNASALKEKLTSLVSYGDKDAEAQYLADLAYTLSEKRSNLRWRTFHLAASAEDLMSSLENEQPLALRAKSNTYNLGFVFTGQGAQWSKMGSSLLAYPKFRQSVEQASSLLSGLGCPYNVKDIFEHGSEEINHPLFSQTICTVLQVALVDLLESWNVRPCVTVGHSSGEIAAAYCARKLTRQAAWKIAYYRGLVSVTLHEKNSGGMMAVGATFDTVARHINALKHEFENPPEIGCFNSPKNVTVTGERLELQKLKSAFDEDHIFNRLLPVQVPYHSKQMHAVSGKYESLLDNLSQGEKLASSQDIRMISSLTGVPVEEKDLDEASYWVRNLTSPVRFSDALVNSCSKSPPAGGPPIACIDELVELGPHSTLRTAIREGLVSIPALKGIEYSHAITRKDLSNRTLLGTIASLRCRGYPLNIDVVNRSAASARRGVAMVQLPPYVFNHEKATRIQSRLINNLRLPRHPRHELLGSPALDWNGYEPKWRNFLRTSEMPWTRDNQLNGNIIYPGVASLVMAMEAARRLPDAPLKPCGYRVRNISYKAALIIPDTKEGIEISFSMRRTSDFSESHQPWYEFYLRSFDSEKDSWVEHSSGLVRVEGKNQQNTIDDGAEQIWSDLSLESLTTAQQECTKAMDVRDYYQTLKSSGVLFGPTMQNLTTMAISQSENNILGKVRIPSMLEDVASSQKQPLVMHPTTMESLAQILLPICTSAESPLGSELLTTFTEELWVSASIRNQPENSFQARAWSSQKGPSKWRTGMDVWNADCERQITARGMMLAALSQIKETPARFSLCYRVTSCLSTDLLVSAAAFQALHKDQFAQKDTKYLKYMELISASFILDTLTKLQSRSKAVLPKYQELYNWMKDLVTAIKGGSMPLIHPTALNSLNKDCNARARLQDKLATCDSKGAALVEVGKSLAPILTGARDTAPFKPLLAEARQDATWGNIRPLFSEYVTALGRDHPSLTVLEVGAGSGDATKQVLEAMGSSVKHYHFTDASDALFEDARIGLSEWSEKVQYGLLDLQSDFTSDNIQPGSYDVVVAAHGLASSNAHKALKRLRNLLKPGGKLLLIQSVNPSIIYSRVLFGIFPGLWGSTRFNEKELTTLFPQAGFCQDTLVFHDTDDKDTQDTALFISTAANIDHASDGKGTISYQKCFVVSAGNEDRDLDASSWLKCQLENMAGLEVNAVDIQHLKKHDLQDSICVALLNGDSINLSTVGPTEYENLKHMLLTCRGMILVSNDELSDPLASMATGMLRTVRSERHFEGVNLVTLAVGGPYSNPKRICESILQLYRSNFMGRQVVEGNGEYVFRDGVFWTNRLHTATDVNEFMEYKFAPKPSIEPLGLNIDKPLKLETKRSGDLKTLEFTPDASHSAPLLDDQVKVHVEAWGLGSLSGTLTTGGVENSLGREATGRVVHAGAAVQNVRVGDRVMTLDAAGALGTYATVPSQSAQVIPKTAEFAHGAGIPFCFCTAFYALYEVARLQQGETVLVQLAASGLGQAAVQLARLAGTEILATVQTSEEKDILTKSYGLEESLIFYDGDDSIQAGLAAATEGHGVDVVLRTRSSTASYVAWRCMAPFGRFLDLIKNETSFRTTLDMLPFSHGAIYASIDVVNMAQKRPERVWSIIKEIGILYRGGKIQCPQPLVQYNFSEIERAVADVQEGKLLGAPILMPHEEDMVPKRHLLPAYHFPPDTSYVLAGGLGGLGRSIARWMASRGARNFIFLSRSGVRGETTSNFVRDLRQKGCRVEIGRCDISKLDDLAKTLDSCRSNMPPIKGCYQCSMVLRDSLFSNMSHEQFIDCVRPKVQGSANLAQALPRDLDFLLFLSSSSAIIGNRGQANYSAANMYMDTLAEHLVRKGFPAMSINLGSVLSAGWLSENKDSRLTGALSHLTTSEEELLALIEYHVDPRWRAAGSADTCHTVAGLRTAEYFSQHGVPQPEFFDCPLFTHLRAPTQSSERKDDSERSIKKQLQASINDVGAIVELISRAVAQKLSAMMSVPEEDFEYNRPLTSYGVDSLVTMDFRGWISRTFGAKLSTLDVLNGNSIEDLSKKIGRGMGLMP